MFLMGEKRDGCCLEGFLYATVIGPLTLFIIESGAVLGGSFVRDTLMYNHVSEIGADVAGVASFALINYVVLAGTGALDKKEK